MTVAGNWKDPVAPAVTEKDMDVPPTEMLTLPLDVQLQLAATKIGFEVVL
jgi:hypothetical protein